METKFIDIHAHLNFSAYEDDLKDVISRAQKADVIVFNVGTQKDTSKRAIELAEQNVNMYAIIGLHPVHTGKSHHDEDELGPGGKAFVSRGEDFDFDYYEKLASHPKVLAIGECGLDYFHLEDGGIEKQKDIFIKHIELANKVNKPLMLHVRSSNPSTVQRGLTVSKLGTCRSAYKDACEILKEYAKVPFNFHFFAGSLEETDMILELGGQFSFTGVITFAKEYAELIKHIPLEKIMSETDCPYVTPAPYRGKKNEPAYVVEVVKKIAEIKGLDLEVVKVQIMQNARKFFSLT